MFPRSAKRLIAVAALLAMLAVQLSGGLFHYFCECSGTSVFTFEEHCHKEGKADMDAEDAPGHRHHEDHEDEPQDDDHHHHELVKTPNDAVPPLLVSAPALSAPVVFLIEIPEITVVPSMEQAGVALRPPDIHGNIPPPVQVVRSVVFLI